MNTFKKVRTVVEKAFLQNAGVLSGLILPEGAKVGKALSCPQEDKAISFEQLYLLPQNSCPVSTSFVTHPDETILAQEFSPDKTSRVTVRQHSGGKDSGLVFEVYNGDQIVFKKTLTKEHHGPVATGEAFMARPLSFHPDGKKIVYLAELKKPKGDLFSEDPFIRESLRNFEYRANFGENYSDFYRLGIFVIDIEKESVYKVKDFPKDMIPISAQFIPGSELKLLITAFKHERFLSGISMCLNKPSAIYVLDNIDFEDLLPKKNAEADKKKKEEEAKKDEKKTESILLRWSEEEWPGEKPKPTSGEGSDKTPLQITKVSGDYPIAMFPSVSPSGSKIVFFFSKKFKDLHLFTTGFAVVDLVTKQVTELVDSEEPDNDSRSFYVYYDAHNKLKWLSETLVAFPSYDKARTVINFIDIESKSRKMTVIPTTHFETDNVKLLDWTQDLALFSSSNFYIRGRVGVASHWQEWARRDVNAGDIKWEEVKSSKEPVDWRLSEGAIQETKTSIRDVTGYVWELKDFKDDKGKSVDQNKKPLFVDFHGGPHWFSSVMYSTLYLVLLKRGFKILTLNFSGSWSFGQDFNERLCGKVGEIDIQELIDWLDANKELYDPENVTFDGGSYSGLQSLVLMQKHHKRFKNIIAYNPVANFLTGLYSVDIPEWNISEALGKDRLFNVTQDLSEADVKRFIELSPALQNFDKDTKTKLLFIIGDRDRRVHPAGGLYLFRKLKALGLNTRCLVYPDQGHGVRKPKFVIDYLMNIFDLVLDFETNEKELKASEESKKEEEKKATEQEAPKKTETKQPEGQPSGTTGVPQQVEQKVEEALTGGVDPRASSS